MQESKIKRRSALCRTSISRITYVVNRKTQLRRRRTNLWRLSDEPATRAQLRRPWPSPATGAGANSDFAYECQWSLDCQEIFTKGRGLKFELKECVDWNNEAVGGAVIDGCSKGSECPQHLMTIPNNSRILQRLVPEPPLSSIPLHIFPSFLTVLITLTTSPTSLPFSSLIPRCGLTVRF